MGHRALRQHQPSLGGEGTDQVQRRAAMLTIERTPHGLSVDRNLWRHGCIRLEDRAHPAQEATLEALRVDQHQHPAERIVRGNAIRQVQKPPQPALLASTIEGDVLESLGFGDDRTDRDHQDVNQLVLNFPITARVLDPGELGHQRLEHGSCSFIRNSPDLFIYTALGHQWKVVWVRMVSGWSMRARHRRARAWSRSASEAKFWLAMASSTSGQRCSAGCNSGE